jgi:hypothetical protein
MHEVGLLRIRVAAVAIIMLSAALPARAQTAADAAGFKRAIEEHVARTSVNFGRPCVNLWKIAPTKQPSFPDTRFDWAPASFIIRLDGETDPEGRLARVFGLAARHGYFERRKAPDGAPEYRMTWAGYAKTNGQGCFYTGSVEIEAAVQSFERQGVETWRVVATGRPRNLLPWASDPEFWQIFKSYSDSRYEYGRNTYEVARRGVSLAVVDRRPPPDTLGIPRFLLMLQKRGPRPEQIAKEAGVLTRERVGATLADYVTKGYAMSNRVCLRLPHMVDETNLVEDSQTPEGQAPAPLHFTIYNAAWRPSGLVDATRNYDILTRLESAGVVTSERLSATEYRGQKANGAIRFTVTDAWRAMIPRNQPGCVLVGHVVPTEVLDFEQFTAINTRPAFVARTKFTPLPGREALLVRFRNLERLSDPGGAMIGNFYFVEGKLGAEASYPNPEFEADGSTLPPLPFANSAR